LLVAGAAGLAAVVCLCLFIALGEPAWEGRPLRAWLRDYNTAGKSEKLAAADAAFRAMGSGCIPRLTALARPKRSILPAKFDAWLRAHLPWDASRPGDDRLAVPAVRALLALGPEGEAAVAHLLAMDGTEPKAGSVLAWPVVIRQTPSVLEALCCSTNRTARLLAVNALAAKAAGTNENPGLIWLSAPGDGEQYCEFLWADSRGATSALSETLASPHAEVRRASAEALSFLGRHTLAPNATPLFNGGVYDPYNTARLVVNKAARDRLVAALGDPEMSVRAAAQDALREIELGSASLPAFQ
jgi:hypothetical protein